MHDLQAAWPRRRVLAAAAALALPSMLARAAAPSRAAWPTRPLKLVVGFPAGTSPDFLARVFAEPLAQALGQPVVVENKPGATGIIGMDAVAKSNDGHTIGLTGNGPLTTAKALNPRMPLDVQRDLRPISLLAASPFVLTGATSLPGEVRAAVAEARAQGDRLSYGSIGLGSGSHLAMELLKTRAGLKAVHVPFPGFPQVGTAMAGGQVHLGFMVPSVAMPLAQAGRVRVLAVSTASRTAVLPEVPSLAEALGIPFDVAGWNAVFGPAAMPEAHALRVAEALGRNARTPAVRQQLFDSGWQALGTAPEGLARRIREDTALWADVIRISGTKGE